MLSGTPLIVTNTNDSGSGSLRAEIAIANADNAGDTITFAGNLAGGTIRLKSGELKITGSMTIAGPGASQLTIDGGWDGVAGDSVGSRIFHITSTTAAVNITGLTLTHANGYLFANDGGGAIDNAGFLTLANNTISGSTADYGVIYNYYGTLNSTNNTIAGNFGKVGVMDNNLGTLTSIHDTFSGNTGGGIDNDGTLMTTNDVVYGNIGISGGAGGVENAGTWTSTNDTIYGNTTQSLSGGGVVNEGTWKSTNDTISGNSSTYSNGSSGGVGNFGTWTSVNNTISGNSATHGGGVGNYATWMSTNDTISGNAATDYGGGVLNPGTWTSSNDTLNGNTANNYGGGVQNHFGTWTSSNDTIAENSAGNYAGGVDADDSNWTAINDTIVGNSAAADGGVRNSDGSNDHLLNTIISGNSGGDLSSIQAILNTTTSNLIGGNVAQILAIDSNGKPLLANNGGPTQTIALVSGSPAIGHAVLLTTVSQFLAAGATTIHVADGTFVAAGQQLKVDNEFVTVTATTGTTITVTRAAGGGTSHTSGAVVTLAYDQTGALRVANDIGAVEKVTINSSTFKVTGSTLDVYENAAANAFQISVGATSFTVAVNSDSRTFNKSSISTINIHGGPGKDSLTFTGSSGNDNLSVSPGTLLASGSGYTVSGTNLGTIVAHGGGGTDIANLYSSNGINDAFVGTSTYAQVIGAGFNNIVYGFSQATGIDQFPTAGQHTATLYDSTQSDTFVSFFIGATTVSELSGSGFNNVAIGYPVVSGVNSDLNPNPGISHIAYLYTSSASDAFVATPAYAQLSGTAFNNIVDGYPTVVGVNADHTAGAVHNATLNGSSTVTNTYVGTTTFGTLYGTGFTNYALQFTATSAVGVGKSTDVAYLYGASSSDTFIATPAYGRMYGTSYNNVAVSFQQVYMYGTPGSTAYLYDAPGGNDFFYGRGNYGVFTGTGFFNDAINFTTIVAISSPGDVNTTNISGLDYTFQKIGTWAN